MGSIAKAHQRLAALAQAHGEHDGDIGAPLDNPGGRYHLVSEAGRKDIGHGKAGAGQEHPQGGRQADLEDLGIHLPIETIMLPGDGDDSFFPNIKGKAVDEADRVAEDRGYGRPATSILKKKDKTGSKTIFKKEPLTMPIIASLVAPSERSSPARAIFNPIKGLPRSMMER